MNRTGSSSSVVSRLTGAAGPAAKLSSLHSLVYEESQEELTKKLLLALLGGFEAEAVDLVVRGAEINATFPDGCSPIIKSCNYGYESVLDVLLEREVYLDKQSNNGNTGLMKGKSLLIYICNYHVLSHLLLIYICKLHWNLNAIFECQVNSF
jgi:hypothetical protein